MNDQIRRYHYMVRIVGALGLIGLVQLSDYAGNMSGLILVGILYFILSTGIRFQIGILSENWVERYNLFMDVSFISIAIVFRGGIRSDFYLGYFLILCYTLLIRNKNLLNHISVWIVLNYSIATMFFSPNEDFSLKRLFIRLVLLLGAVYLLREYDRRLIEEETLRMRAEHLAMYDTLTGAYNRRILDHIDELYFKNEIDVFVVLVDIDDFKMINDRYGHDSGDEILKSLAACFNKEIGDNSFFVRYGGEEFLLLTPSSNYENLVALINKIKDDFAKQSYVYIKENIDISFTAGVSFKAYDDGLENAITKADEALYQGKASGKNSIVLKGDYHV